MDSVPSKKPSNVHSTIIIHIDEIEIPYPMHCMDNNKEIADVLSR